MEVQELTLQEMKEVNGGLLGGIVCCLLDCLFDCDGHDGRDGKDGDDCDSKRY
jgi:hypothetical protein